jgi:two-component system, chemotaxis family, response regulator Rcp1
LSNHSDSSLPTQTILCAEDNPHDRYFLGEAFETIGLNVKIETVTDGDELLQRLTNPISYDLVVMDANLPRRNALEVLATIQSKGQPMPSPVVVVSSFLSQPHRDKLEALGVRAVFTKPMDFDQYLQLAKTLSKFLQPA